MLQDQNRHIAKLLTATVLLILVMISFNRASAFETTLASNPPERCTGYGDLESISLTDWEVDLGSWTVGTHDVADLNTFDTPDWAVVGSLPDSRAGMAAFVADLVADCGLDDETGALTLDSQPIVIPGGTEVPRISIDHWFEIEPGWDGGNLKIKVGGGGSPFRLIPATAIEVGPYSGTLFPPLDEFGTIFNTNPLADQDAFTGTIDGQPTGSWIQSRINLLGIAAAGDTIQLRFDFGVDDCTVDVIDPPFPIGWYVDEVEFYSCEAELPPSNCGNGVIDEDDGEQCDDGNDFIDDGCSNTCQIESGWQCTAPTPPGTINDPSFEAGRGNPFWDEVSNNGLNSPICDAATCNTGGGTGPSDGTFWVWLGGIRPFQEGSVSQSIVIPSSVTELTFDLEVPACDSAMDYFEVLIDGNQKLRMDGSSPRCGIVGYSQLSLDISAYADDGTHDLEFHSITVSENGSVSNFFIDVIAMPGSPSMCTPVAPSLTLVKKVINNIGGSAVPADWTLTATGSTSFGGDGPRVSSTPGFVAGNYDLSESDGSLGYLASDWVCDTGSQDDVNTITVGPEDSVTCTITNTYVGVAHLTLVKHLPNDDGGSATQDQFQAYIDGNPVAWDTPISLAAGAHTASEDTLAGYQASSWFNACAANGAVTLNPGDDLICEITNDDAASTLTLVKHFRCAHRSRRHPGRLPGLQLVQCLCRQRGSDAQSR